MINYTAHCGETVWGTPLSIGQVNSIPIPISIPWPLATAASRQTLATASASEKLGLEQLIRDLFTI